MEPNPKLKICYDRIIPYKQGSPEQIIHTMRKDAVLNEAGTKTLREAFHTIDPRNIIPAPHMALISSKKWPTGSILKCRFLEGSPVQQAKVTQMAKLWEEFANIQIEFVTTEDGQVRIAFQSDSGSWSAIGQDALDTQYFPKDQQTMNFGWLEDNTDDSEYERVVVHEFGHALGCIHEHQSPNEQLEWNVDAVYQYFSGPPNNWDKATIDSNILEKYSQNGVTETIFDQQSIMLYQFPAELFLNHVGTPLNYHLSTKDKAFIQQLYPHD